MDDIINDVISGVKSGTYHVKWVALMKIDQFLVKPLQNALGYRGASNDTNKQKDNLKVVCVGYGRTGTYSVKLALDKLGFNTLHTQHLYESPKILDMWTETVFKPAITAGELALGNPDFDLITSHGFSAVADLPMALYFEELHHMYPDCKFILTTRESSEAWFKSWNVMTGNIAKTTQITGYFFPHVQQLQLYLRWMYGIVNKDINILTTPLQKLIPPQIRNNAISSYEEHNRKVREVIPPDLLLEYNIKDGWEPLCTFLNITECPQSPFPKTNSSLSIVVQTFTGLLVAAVSTILGLFIMYRIGSKISSLLSYHDTGVKVKKKLA